jgi:periplasmic protein TonB
MRILFSFIVLIYCACSYGQSANCPMGIPDVEPCFPGGQTACAEFIDQHVVYPEAAKEEGLQGRVLVSFVVYCDGSVRDVTVIKSVSPELDQEALRIFSLMPPWTPGTIDGQTVQAKYTFPVSFSLVK